MRKKWQHRPPAVFRLDQDHLIVDSAMEKGASSERRAQMKPEPEFEALAITIDNSARSSRRGVRWAMLFWCALGGLMLLAMGVAVSGLITDLFARNQELGWLGLALAILAIVSLFVIAVRETTGLMRLATVEKFRLRAAEMIASGNRIEARALVHELLALTRKMPHLARGRANLEGHLGEIIDGPDMVRLAERELMTPLDQQARKLISVAATRVSVITALSPRAVVDVLFVLGTALILVRRLAFLYGARPGYAQPSSIGTASCNAFGGDRRTGCERQLNSTAAGTWHSGQIIGATRRGRAQRPPHGTVRPRRGRPYPSSTICRPASSYTFRSYERSFAQFWRCRRTARCRIKSGHHRSSIEQAACHVRFGSKADMTLFIRDVRFTPESGHQNWPALCSA